jgi:Tfp pilus assembly protein PilO
VAATKKTDQMSSSNLIIMMLLITLIAVGVTVLVSKSLVTTIIRDGKVVQKKSAAEKQLTKDVDAAPNLVSSYGELNEKGAVLADALPNNPDFPSLIVTLENMSRTAGLKLKNVAPSLATSDTEPQATGDSSVAPVPQPYKFSVGFTGGFVGLSKLLTTLETSARPMRVLDIQLTGGGSSLNGLLDVETYYQAKAVLPIGKEIVK